MEILEGGCHCGAVRFRATVEDGQPIVDCNCSICTKKGILHFIVPEDRFELLRGEPALATYTFHTHVAAASTMPRGSSRAFRSRSSTAAAGRRTSRPSGSAEGVAKRCRWTRTGAA
jgi:hypothetical protein